jgi:hypothetical protein
VHRDQRRAEPRDVVGPDSEAVIRTARRKPVAGGSSAPEGSQPASVVPEARQRDR